MGSTPLATTGAALKKLLEDELAPHGKIPVFWLKPYEGDPDQGVVIQPVLTEGESAGLGDTISATEHGHYYRIRIQIDVYHQDQIKNIEYADQIKTIFATPANKAALKADSGILDVVFIDGRPLPVEVGARYSRYLLEYQVEAILTVTKA